uniref:Ig-like domain-containing protein n=1 Tax=Sarcophilus harrisii TaxID=9305 RepID=G3VYR4_SARHA
MRFWGREGREPQESGSWRGSVTGQDLYRGAGEGDEDQREDSGGCWVNSPGGLAPDWGEHFTLQFKAECYFENGTEHVRHVHRAIYNRQEYARFDSDLGKFVAVTELGRCSAEYWNSQKEILENVRAEVDTVCIYNYKSYNSFFLFSPAHPKVTVYPSKMAPPGHHNLLVCSVSGFYPGDIKVQWFLNGREETAGVTLVMLEMTHRRGDVYTCQVEHSSLQGPVHLDWSPLLLHSCLP